MRRMIEKILNCYGQNLELVQNGKAVSVRAFFQSKTSGSSQNAGKDYLPLGKLSQWQYTYIGPAEPEAKEGDELLAGGKSYLLRRVEVIQDASGPVYCWGLCVEKGGNQVWPKQS